MSDLSLTQLLRACADARDAFAAAQKTASREIAARLDKAVTILRECSRALYAINAGDPDLDDALDTLLQVSRELADDESEVDDADD